MQLWRNTFLVKMTLFFFAAMLLFNPVYAQQETPINLGGAMLPEKNALPVMYVNEAEAQQLAVQLKDRGFVVREGTLAQLDQMTEVTAQKPQTEDDTDAEAAADSEKKKTTCEKATKKQDGDEQLEQAAADKLKDKTAAVADKKEKLDKEEECEPKETQVETEPGQSQSQGQGQGQNEDHDLPPLLEPPPPYPAQPEVHGYIGVQGNVSYGGGGSNHDFAKVFFIFAGIAVVAAFVVYAGKYIVDIANGKAVNLWRELTVNSTFLTTDAGRHGQFVGAKLATGFVSDELIQLALVGEVGNTDLNLVLNEYTDPTLINFSATYWMLGASARLHLTNKLVNASYLYLDFMGGTTSRSATDIIAAARLGASFGLDNHWRLGASMGAQYIGLDEDQGFSNDGENYWLTYGVEIGAQF